MRSRWGRPPEEISDERAWSLEVDHLASRAVNLICALSPERIIIGGGLAREPTLLPLVRSRVQELTAGYFDVPELGDGIDGYVVPPALRDRAGVLGALELARRAASAGEDAVNRPSPSPPRRPTMGPPSRA
jgi:fructokinase